MSYRWSRQKVKSGRFPQLISVIMYIDVVQVKSSEGEVRSFPQLISVIMYIDVVQVKSSEGEVRSFPPAHQCYNVYWCCTGEVVRRWSPVVSFPQLISVIMYIDVVQVKSSEGEVRSFPPAHHCYNVYWCCTGEVVRRWSPVVFTCSSVL